jgi:DNA-directed RNA polymerase subunit beta
LHRSPGVFFERQAAQNYVLGKIIPYRGSWVEFEFDAKNLLYVRIDRKRKFYGSVFLRALGLKSDTDILRAFYTVSKLNLKENRIFWQVDETLTGIKLGNAITSKSGETLHQANRKIKASTIQTLRDAKVTEVEVTTAEISGAWVAADVIDQETGEVLAEANQELTATVLSNILDAGIATIEVFYPERDEVGMVVAATLKKDPVKSQSEALLEIYRKLRPGDPPTLDTATQLFYGMFFDPRKYDFSRVGRMKFNIKLYDKLDYVPQSWLDNPETKNRNPLDRRVLDEADFLDTIKYLLRLRRGVGAADDIDHLGNRRVRAVGELLENQFRIGLVRMERAIKEKMAVFQEMHTAMPHDLVNAKPVMAAIREFFGSSQLSQFMDQTNPLSEITHKRRLSALGPGGLSRERAGFEVRDVHATHYGRICPIETPEGPNIGLISSLSCFARINEYGFIESPYRRVAGNVVQDDVRVISPGATNLRVGQVLSREEMMKVLKSLETRPMPPEFEAHSDYLSAWDEDKYVIAQANMALDKNRRIVDELINARKSGNTTLIAREEVEYMDVSPKQLVSVAASLIPFLENDDANRALMGSNMQRQAVPLLRADAPIVGTGMERSPPATPAPSSCAAATASLIRSTPNASSSASKAMSTKDRCRVKSAPISIRSPSSNARTRTPASTRSPSFTRDSASRKATCSPTDPVPTRANSPSAATSSSPSCPGAAITTKTPSSSAKNSSRKTTTPRSTSRSSKSRPAIPNSAPRRSPATSPTSPKASSAASMSPASS